MRRVRTEPIDPDQNVYVGLGGWCRKDPRILLRQGDLIVAQECRGVQAAHGRFDLQVVGDVVPLASWALEVGYVLVQIRAQSAIGVHEGEIGKILLAKIFAEWVIKDPRSIFASPVLRCEKWRQLVFQELVNLFILSEIWFYAMRGLEYSPGVLQQNQSRVAHLQVMVE